MANQKVSEMSPLSQVHSTDITYVVSGGEPRNASFGTIFGAMPDALFAGSCQLGAAEEVVANGGNLSNAVVVNAITTDNADRTFTLSAGTVANPLPLFMLKVIYLKTQFGGKGIVNGGLISNISQLEFTNAGDSAILLSTSAGWIFLSGTAKVVYAPPSAPFGFA